MMASEQKIHYFEIKQNDQVGRYAVASCDLEPGDEILSEAPFAYGPKTDSAPVCLGCYSFTSSLCTSCGWPVCDSSCEAISTHKNAECKIFTDGKVKFFPVKDMYAPCLQYECITPLRVLLAMEKNKDTWNREIECMQSHIEDRKSKELWHFNTINIVNYLRGPCKLQKFDEVLIHTICGLLDVNTFEARTRSGNSIRCLYPKASIFSHNCITNIAHSIFSDGYGPDEDYRIVVRSAVPIRKGSELFARYAYSTWPTIIRREYLRESKYFDCQCERCGDPTELGTNMSALKCSKCNTGNMLCINPFDDKSHWKCTQCANLMKGSTIKQIFQTFREEIEHAETTEPGTLAFETIENLYDKYSSILHPRNAYITNLMISLVRMYGRVDGCTFDTMSHDQYKKKLDFCERILENIDVVEPGYSRMRGIILYELHAPAIMVAKSLYTTGSIDKAEFCQKFQNVINILQEAADILLLEPPMCNEHRMGRLAAQAYQQISQNFFEIVENI